MEITYITAHVYVDANRMVFGPQSSAKDEPSDLPGMVEWV